MNQTKTEWEEVEHDTLRTIGEAWHLPGQTAAGVRWLAYVETAWDKEGAGSDQGVDGTPRPGYFWSFLSDGPDGLLVERGRGHVDTVEAAQDAAVACLIDVFVRHPESVRR